MTQELINRLRALASGPSIFWETANELEEQALALDIQARSIEAVKSANERLAAEIVRLRAELEASRKDAARLDWIDKNSTFMDVDHTRPVHGCNIPVLASVSKRIWYHATDDVVSYPFSAVIDAAMKEGEA